MKEKWGEGVKVASTSFLKEPEKLSDDGRDRKSLSCKNNFRN